MGSWKKWKERREGILFAVFGTGALLLLFSFLLWAGERGPESRRDPRNQLFLLCFLEASFLPLVLPLLFAKGEGGTFKGLFARGVFAGGIFLLGNLLFQILVTRGRFFLPSLLFALHLALFSTILGNIFRLARLFLRSFVGGYLVAALAGFSAVGSFFLLNPLIGLPLAGNIRSLLTSLALRTNPLSFLCPPGLLGIDWLRKGILYKECVIGPFYPFYYPSIMEAFLLYGFIAFLTSLLWLVLKNLWD